MKKVVVLLSFLGIALIPSLVFGQFQSCLYCDVQAFQPDPLHVKPCEQSTVIIHGIGFQDRSVNDCDRIPTVAVRSTRPDRVEILSFRVLDDTQIEVQFKVPCTATEGYVGLDVTIDDDPGDALQPYACGNARMYVDRLVLAVKLNYLNVTALAEGTRIEWSTSSETNSLGFIVYKSTGGTSEMRPVNTGIIAAKGLSGGAEYAVLDSEPAGSRTVRYYILAEIGTAGTTLYGPAFATTIRQMPSREVPARLP